MLNLLKQAQALKILRRVVFIIQKVAFAGFNIPESRAGKAFPGMGGGLL